MQPVMETILHRRSIRRFAPEQIREETLRRSSRPASMPPAPGDGRGSSSPCARTGP